MSDNGKRSSICFLGVCFIVTFLLLLSTIALAQIADTWEKESQNKIDQNPTSSVAYNEMGMAKRLGGDNQAAIENFSKAIELDPQFAEAYYNRGLSYGSSQIGKADSALLDINKAIFLNDNNGSYYFGRAIIEMDLGDFEKCRQDIDKAQQLGFQVPPAFIQEMNRSE